MGRDATARLTTCFHEFTAGMIPCTVTRHLQELFALPFYLRINVRAADFDWATCGKNMGALT